MTTVSINAAPVINHSATERRRQFVVRAVFFIFILSLIEGPLRKWFLPGLATPLTVLRDPIVIALYGYCFIKAQIQTQGWAALWLGFAAITVVVGFVQYWVVGLPTWGWLLGVRTYWLYMPLAFVVAKTFRMEDIHTFFKLCLWISIPYALLVASQYNAPAEAFLNQGVGADAEATVGVADGIVRPFGLFTYTGPNVQFTAFMIAVWVAFYISQVPMKRRAYFIWGSAAAVGSMAVLTGSRSIYFLAAMIVAFTLGGMLVTRPNAKGLRWGLGIIGFVGLAGFLFVFVFPDMLAAMGIRFERAASAEGSLLNRAVGGLTRWIDPLFTAPVFGMGIGAGAPGVARLLGLPALLYGESDLQRNINELGVLLGAMMLALRFGTVFWVVASSLKAAYHQHLIVLPLAGFVVFPFLMGQITHSPLIAFLVWLTLGLIFVICRNSHSSRAP